MKIHRYARCVELVRDDSGAVVHNPPRELIADLDSLPWPARELIDLPAYVAAWRRHHGHGAAPVLLADLEAARAVAEGREALGRIARDLGAQQQGEP